MFVPTGGDEGPEWRDLDDCRITEVEFGDGTKRALHEKGVLNGKPRRRLSQFWTTASSRRKRQKKERKQIPKRNPERPSGAT